MEYLRVTTIMKNMATIIQAFENDKQYEIELISIHRIPYFRLLIYGVLTTDNANLLSQHFSFQIGTPQVIRIRIIYIRIKIRNFIRNK